MNVNLNIRIYDHRYWPYRHCERRAGGARLSGVRGTGRFDVGTSLVLELAQKEIAPETSAPPLQEDSAAAVAVAAVSFKSDLSHTRPPAPAGTTMVPGSGLPKVHTPSKGRVVARAADRLINDKATFYPVRFRNIDKLCKRLIRISHPSVLPARRSRGGVAVACRGSLALFRGPLIFPLISSPKTAYTT